MTGADSRRSADGRVYAAALRLLPAAYRRDYGEAMLETFDLRSARAGGSLLRRIGLLLRELAGILRIAWGEHHGGAAPERIPGREPGRMPGRERGRPSEPRTGTGGSRLSAWPREMKHALRRLGRSPGFTVATVLTLGVAAAGNAAIFSVVHSILIRPLPYPSAERLVAVRAALPPLEVDDVELPVGPFLHYREQSSSFTSTALYERAYRNVTADGEPLRIETIRATEDFFPTLGVDAALGRTLGTVDATPDADPAVVLADALWRTRYGSDERIVGRSIVMDDESFTVVGVMPPGFEFPRAGTSAWTAWPVDRLELPLMSFSYEGVGRLREAVTVAAANDELARVIDGFPESYGWDRADFDRMGLVVFVRPLKSHVIGDSSEVLWLFAGAGLFVMLLACTNVANLFLVRSEARVGEASIRAALGASRAHLLRYWMSEGIWVAAFGALLGLLLATSALGAIVRFAPELPRMETVRLDGATLGFVAALAALAALVFGYVSMVAAGGRAGTLSARHGVSGSPAAQRRREALVAAQVALALILLVAAALMMQSVRNLTRADPGFEPEGTLTFRISLSAARYPDREAAAAFHRQLVERLQALPGVEEAGIARCLPLQGWCGGNQVSSPDSPLAPEAFREVVSVKPVSAGYFEALRLRLLAGRFFAAADATQRTGAAVVSRKLAARLFPATEPRDVVGKRIYPQAELDVDEWFTIVGVVDSVQRSRIDEPPAEMLYVPLLGLAGDRHLSPIHDMTVAVRVAGEPLAAIAPVRRVVRELDADMPMAQVRTLADIHAEAMARTRFTMLLLMVAAGTGLLLGAIGIYGVVSWATRQRTAEFGVRAAFGARAADILALVLRRSIATIAVGVTVGILGSLMATRLLTAMLYQIVAGDITTLAGVSLLLIAIGAVATWLPARRAARIDPSEALRSR